MQFCYAVIIELNKCFMKLTMTMVNITTDTEGKGFQTTLLNFTIDTGLYAQCKTITGLQFLHSGKHSDFFVTTP